MGTWISGYVPRVKAAVLPALPLLLLAAARTSTTPVATTVTVTVTLLPHAASSSAIATAPASTSSATKVPARDHWGGSTNEIVYAVGEQPFGGLVDVIPPGRYQVTVVPGAVADHGSWMRCDDFLCGPSYSSHADCVTLLGYCWS